MSPFRNEYERHLTVPPIFPIEAIELIYSVVNGQRPATASGVTKTIEWGLIRPQERQGHQYH